MSNLASAAQAVIHHPLFALGLTLACYQLAVWAYEKTRSLMLQPMMISMALLIALLLLLGIDYPEYREHTQPLSLLLGPATVALAVPLFLNLKRIRQLLWPTLITLGVAGLLATVLGVGLGFAFGLDHGLLMALAPKSVTTPIAMLVADKIGGAAALAAVFVMITGIFGAILGTGLLKRLKITHPAAQGMALGLTAHAVGTAQGLQESEECGAFAALAMSLMGMGTALLLPLAVALLS